VSADEVDTTLAALADPVRRRTLELLADRPHRAGELADALAVSAPVMSRHLRVLRTAALVDDVHPPDDARVRIYSLRREPIDELRSWLVATEAGWALQLSALKEHAERA
jgi:DNA-binding transcriptional ArsR family regulator